jgi:WD40 repeat protein/tRNA A-37 threonylcarbamoyl transferase component Bud32
MKVKCPNPDCGQVTSLQAPSEGAALRCPTCGAVFPLSNTQEKRPTATQVATTPPPRTSTSQTLPARIGRFEIRSLLGRGGFGTVYRAHDPHLGRDVALKVAHAGTLEDRTQRERFLREARAAASLRHPHLVPVYDAGRVEGSCFLAAACIEGPTLDRACREKTLDLRQSVQIVRQLAGALAYAHRKGIIHRDVKPANVLLDARGWAYLTDFGLARQQESQEKLTHDGTILGTPAYMAPEQAADNGKALPASDQYSLGVVLYELLCGRTPFQGSPSSILYQVLHTDPPAPRDLNSDVPRDLEQVCLMAMARRPEDRYADCQALANDLRRWLDDEPVEARPLGKLERLQRWSRREPALALTGSVALLALLALVLVPVFMATRLAVAVAARERSREQLEERRAEAAQKAEEARNRQRQAQEAGQKALTATEELKAQTTRAEEARKNAETAAARAAQGLKELEQRKHELARYRYVADINLAATALHEGGGPLDQLKAHLPKAGQEDLRGFAWYHLHPLAAAAEQNFQLPVKGIVTARFLPGGTHLAIVTRAHPDSANPKEREDLTVGSWNLAQKQHTPRATIPTHGWVLYPETFLSPDGTAILAENLAEGLVVKSSLESVPETRLANPGSAARMAAFSGNGKILATCHYRDRVNVWDVPGKKQTWQATVPSLLRLVVSPDGKLLATARQASPGELEIALWDVADGKSRTLPGGHKGDGVRALTFSPGGEALASLSDKEIKVWRLEGGKKRITIPVGKVPWDHIAFAPDGKRLLTTVVPRAQSSAATHALWDVEETGGQSFPAFQARASVVFSPDGRLLVGINATGDTLEIRAIPGGELRTEVALGKGDAVALAYTSDGQRLAVCHGDGQVRFWPRALLDRLSLLNRHGSITGLAFNSRGKVLAVAGAEEANAWDLETGKPIAPLTSMKPAGLCVPAPGDNRMLAVVSPEGAIQLHTPQGEQTLWSGKLAVARCLAFSPDGKRLAAGLADGTVKVWETGGQELFSEKVQGSAIESLAFSASGEWLACSARDGLALWDLNSRQRHALGKEAARCLAFSPDNQSLVSGHPDGLVRIWDLKTRAVRRVLKGHTAPVQAVVWSPDGRTIATGGGDGTVRLWEPVIGQELLIFRENNDSISTLVFSPDSQILAAGDDKGKVRLWHGPRAGTKPPVH